MKRSFDIDQIALVSAITNELDRQHPGIPADERMNVIFGAATSIVNEYGREPVMAAPGMGLTAWLASDDTGASSRFMAQILAGFMQPNQHGDYPRDADDLGRCIRLLEAAPELVENLPRMAHCGPYWQLIVTRWASWLELYKAERFGELFDEMHLAYACVSL